MTEIGTALRDYLDGVSEPISTEEMRNYSPVAYRDESSSSGGRWWLAVAAVFLLVVGAVALVGSRQEGTAPADVIEDPLGFIRRAIDATVATGRVTVGGGDRRVVDGICTLWSPGWKSFDEGADRWAEHMVTLQGEFTAYGDGERLIVPSSAVPQEWGVTPGWVAFDWARHSEALYVLMDWHGDWIGPDEDMSLGEQVDGLLLRDVATVKRAVVEIVDGVEATRYIITFVRPSLGIADSEVGEDELADSTPPGEVSADAPSVATSLWLDSEGRIVRLSYTAPPTESDDVAEPAFLFTFSGFGEEVHLPYANDVVDFDTLGIVDPQAGVTFPESQPVLRPC